MKKLILLIALALPALLTAQQRDWANYGRYAEANAQLTTPPAVVFMYTCSRSFHVNRHIPHA